MKGSRLAKLEAGLRTHARFVAAAVTISTQIVGTHQRKHHRAAADQISGQANVEQRQSMFAIAVVRPILRRILDADWPRDGAEGNFLNIASALDGCRKQRLIAHPFLIIDKFCLDIDAP